MTEVCDIFIGYDSKEVIAYHTLCQSILEQSSVPVRFMPLNLNNLFLKLFEFLVVSLKVE